MSATDPPMATTPPICKGERGGERGLVIVDGKQISMLPWHGIRTRAKPINGVQDGRNRFGS